MLGALLMKINGHTRMAAVVANPIKHSLSPFIHNFTFDWTEENGVYLAWEIPAEHLAECVANVRNLDMYGINLSMPFKSAVLDFVDEQSEEVRLIGAANTIVNSQGKLVAYNTDGRGFFESLKPYEFQMRGEILTIIGGGGAAIAIIAQAALLGAKKINVLARPSASFEPLQHRLTALSVRTGIRIELISLSERFRLQSLLDESALLVNATSVGMDGVGMPLDEEVRILPSTLVVDIIYKVKETPFLKWAKRQGAQTENGLGMLIGQAAESFRLWTGKVMPTSQVKEALLREIENENKG